MNPLEFYFRTTLSCLTHIVGDWRENKKEKKEMSIIKSKNVINLA